MMQQSFLINGAGLTGLLIAHALKAIGVHVAIIEKRETLSDVGAAIAIPATAIQVLKVLDTFLPEQDRIVDKLIAKAHQVNAIRFTDQLGNVIAEQSLQEAPFNQAPYVALPRQVLIDLLSEKLQQDIQFGTTIKEVEHNDAQSICVLLSNGVEKTFDAVVDCSGIRTALVKHAGLNDLGVVNWRAVVDCPTDNLEPTYMLGNQNNMLLLYPCGKDKVYVYAHVRSAALPDSHTPVTIEQFQQLFADFGGPAREVLQKITNINQLYQGVLESRQTVALRDGRLLFAGDAAAAASPGLQAGFEKAGWCALVLVSHLVGKYESMEQFNQLFADYEDFLLPVFNDINARSDHIIKIGNMRWGYGLNGVLNFLRKKMLARKGPLNTQGWRISLQQQPELFRMLNVSN